MVVGISPADSVPERSEDGSTGTFDDAAVIIREDSGDYTAVMWIQFSKESPPPSEIKRSHKLTIHHKVNRFINEDLQPGASKRTLRRVTGKRKTIIALLVVMLFITLMVSSIVGRAANETSSFSLGQGEIQGNTFAGGAVEIQPINYEGKLSYNLIYHGDGSCAWYLYCNERPVYNIGNDGSLSKRDYIKIGNGKSLNVPDSVLHVGSYKLKAVTDHNVYQDDVVIDGNVYTKFKWPFIGKGGTSVTSTVSIEYSFLDYYYYAQTVDSIPESPGRREYTRIADFAVNDKSGVINRLVSELGSEFTRHYPPPLAGNERSDWSDWYINFLLTFVQNCTRYPESNRQPDLYMYGSIDYFSYPLQTLFHRSGDCEDTSILAAALFDAAGFEAGVTLVYADSVGNRIVGHSTAAVNMNKPISKTSVDLGDFTLAKMKGTNSKAGIEYYLCETTISHQLAAGYIEKKYMAALSSLGKNVNALYPVTVNG